MKATSPRSSHHVLALLRRRDFMAVPPIPPGFRTVTPHLVLRGAGKAIDFYKKAFGAEEIMRMPGPDGKSVMHGEIKIGDSIVMLADEFPGTPLSAPEKLGGTTVSLMLYVKDCDAVFNQAVAAGAKVSMPLMDMFWGDRYGQLTDPFGHIWAIATHKEDVLPEEMAKRGAEAMKKMCPQ
jgi:PhnB protein